MNCGTFSNIISTRFDNTWQDCCLFIMGKVLDEKTQFNGVTMVVKKGKFFNVKVSTTGKNEALNLPDYFCKPKFMMNNEREVQVVKQRRKK